jgi:hypothetical protein
VDVGVQQTVLAALVATLETGHCVLSARTKMSFEFDNTGGHGYLLKKFPLMEKSDAKKVEFSTRAILTK